MILILAVACTITIVLVSLFNIKWGILLAIATKPIIDASWNHYFFGVNTLQIIGVFFPTLVIVKSVLAGKSFRDIPYSNMWLIYLFYNFFSASLILFNKLDPKTILNVSLRVLNGYVGYYMLQTYFYKKSEFKKLLLAFLCAGLFPMAMGIYQAYAGVVWQARSTTGGLARNVGLYHDIGNFKLYSFQTLAAIWLYSAYFPAKKWSIVRSGIIACYGLACGTVIYKAFSKAAFATLGSWLTIWLIFKRHYVTFIIILCTILGINIILDNQLLTNLQTVFLKESTAIHEDSTEREKMMTFAGRWYLWENILNSWNEKPILAKIFGSGDSGGYAHNDYLRNLLSGGILGLFIYILLLCSMGIGVIKRLFKGRSDINLIALAVFSMWMIDSIGLVPSYYPSYQWLVWGIIGLSFKGIENDVDSERNDIPEK